MDRSDEFRLLRVVAERPPDLADQHVEIGVHDVGIGPDSPVQLGLLDDLWPVLNQGRKQVERFRGQVYFRGATKNLPRVGIDRELCESCFQGRLAANLPKPSIFPKTSRAAAA